MVQGDPKLAWIKDAELRGNVDWRRVKELHDSYKYSHSGMGQGAMLAVIIVMSVITAGAASSLAVAAGGGTLGSAAGATFQAFASQTAVSTINNKGNLGAVFKDVTSSASLKGYATSALTAGFSSGVIDPAFGVTGDRVNNITKGFDLASASDIGKFAAYSGAQGAAQAGFKTLVQGGSLKDNLNHALSSQLQGTLQAIAFNAVGDFSSSQNWPESSPQKVALHALVGGLLSEANGGSFATGALAAGANEALISSLAHAVEGNPALLLAASQLIGIAAAGATEGDVQKGAELAKNATAYNFLNHQEVDDLVNDLKGCRGATNPSACRAELTLKYEDISDQKTGMHLLLCTDLGSCETQRTTVEMGNAALDKYESSGGLSWEERLIVRGFLDSNQDDTRLAVQKTVQGNHAEMLSVLPGVGLVVGKGGGSSPLGAKAPGASLDNVASSIHAGQQGKHILGHNNFLPGRSHLNEGIDPQKLLNGARAGEFPVVGYGSRGQPIVDFGKNIGVDGTSGLATRYGTIHSGKSGAHIVPTNPSTVGTKP